MQDCCNKQELIDNGAYKYCKSCGVVQKGKPVMTPTGFHACPKCGCPTVAQGQYCSVSCATAEAKNFKFSKGDRVAITDGFSHIGSLATVEDASQDWSGIVSYKLKEFAGWWPQSSLKETKS